METITNMLFWLTSGLLVPVIIGLVYFFVKSLVMSGGEISETLARRKQRKEIGEYMDGLTVESVMGVCGNEGVVRISKLETGLSQICKATLVIAGESRNEAYTNKAISDYELGMEKEIGRCRMLTKFGPILGLMGTLIPMGPALAGLGSGDIGAMAYNMQVSFATTVIGLLTGAIGFVLIQSKTAAMKRDLSMLDFVANLVEAKERKEGVR